jgi:hypothetical protein
MNDYDYLIKQLNLLVGFLDVSDKYIYDQIKLHDKYGSGLTIEQLYENSYDNYSNHIATSAFLLGFAHFEDFLTKCIVKYLIKNPQKNDYKVPLKTILEKGERLVGSLAEEQSRRLIFSEKVKLIENGFNGISTQLLTEIRFVNNVRNCLMHNNGIADNRLIPKYSDGEKIVFTSGDVHGFGLQARQMAKEVWAQL